MTSKQQHDTQDSEVKRTTCRVKSACFRGCKQRAGGAEISRHNQIQTKGWAGEGVAVQIYTEGFIYRDIS